MPHPSRRAVLQGAIAAAASYSSAVSAASRPPNFIVIVADDLGWGDLACYGNPWVKTPSLDRLAAEGTLYTNGYACSPVCSSSRSGMLTGRFPSRDRMYSWLGNREARTPDINSKRGMPDWLDPAIPTVARTLSASGYATGLYGKWHLGDGAAPEPSAYGFSEYRLSAGNGPRWKDNPLRPVSSERIAESSIEFIRKHAANPFMLNVWFMDPHTPLEPAEALLAEYPNLQGLLRTYCAAITGMDRQIGTLIAALDELNLANDTLILFTSDNGPVGVPMPDDASAGGGTAGPFRGLKGSLYEGGVRVPWIARWPGRARVGKVDNDSIWSGVDLHATLASLAGATLPTGLDGEDRSAALAGPSARKSPLYWDWRAPQSFRPAIHGSPMIATREGNWKFYINPDGTRPELYDVAIDPGEMDNRLEVEAETGARLKAGAMTYWNAMPASPYPKHTGQINYPWPTEKKRKPTPTADPE